MTIKITSKIIEKWVLQRMKKFSLLVIILIKFSTISVSQVPLAPFSFQQLVDDKSTVSNFINSFLKDSDGFLWVGSADGLKRYDGQEFTLFKHEKNNPNSLVHSEVTALCEDDLGRIWIGTGEGVCYFDKKTNRFFTIKDLNKANYVCFNILKDNKGNIWFSIRDKGLFSYDIRTNKLQNFAHDSSNVASLTHNRILTRGLALDPLKRGIWVVNRSGMNFFDFASHKFYNKNYNPKNISILNLNDVSTVVVDGKNLVLFDSETSKILYFDTEKSVVVKEIKMFENYRQEDSDFSYIFVDKQHNLWLSAFNHRAFFYDFKQQKLFEFIHNASKPTSISAPFFWSAFEQNDGTIWLGTSNGIAITNPKSNFYRIYDLAEQYPPLSKAENRLQLFFESATDNTWWLTTIHNHFMNYNPIQNKLEVFKIPVKKNDPNPIIKGFVEHKENIFIFTSKSFYQFEKKAKRLTSFPLPDSLIKKIGITFVKQKGDSIWLFGENTRGFNYRIDTKKWTSYPIMANTAIGVNFLEIDKEGNTWITIHSTGIAKFSKKNQAFELAKIPTDIDFKKIGYSGLGKDKEGNFWLGTYDLVKFNPKTLSFSSELDLNEIQSIIVDKEGKIWTATYNDYTIYDPKIAKIIKQTIPIDKGNLKWNNYLFSLKNGQLISLMKSEVVKMDPLKVIPMSTTDKVLIGKIRLLNDEILLHNSASSVSLASSENGFGISFSTLNTPFDHKYKFSYQLLGFDNTWVSATSNVANYSNLDGGDYVFNVKGIDENGHETAVSSVNIHVDTLFYKSKWFLYLCIISVFGLLYSFVRFRANQRSKILNLKVKSTRLEKDKTEIQYQNLINHLNPHFLFNSLTSLNSLIMTEPKQASKFLQKLSLIYRYILQNKEKDMVSLEQELIFVKHYIDLQKSRFEEGLQINIDIKDEFLASGIVPVTLQNLFENAIKHNTLESDNPLIISVFVDDNCLIVSNILQKKKFVETSNKHGLDSLKSMYKYLTDKPFEAFETDTEFVVKVPLI